MSAHGEILHPSHGSGAGRSRSVTRRRVGGPLTTALVSASAVATAGLLGSPLTQQEVRPAVATTPAATQGSCSSGWKMMRVPDVQRMIDPPATPEHVKATDANYDNYLCAGLSANGSRVERYVDNVRDNSGPRCRGGMDANGMPTGCNGDGMQKQGDDDEDNTGHTTHGTGGRGNHGTGSGGTHGGTTHGNGGGGGTTAPST